MTSNPASNFANLASLTPSYLSYSTGGSTVQNILQTFLTSPNSANYTTMATALAAAQTNFAVGANSTLRVLLAASDGRVAYDSTKTNNTWDAYNPTSSTTPPAAPGVGSFIGENHNTRPEIMLAVLSPSGVGLADRFSSTSVASQKYQATRLGDSTNNNLGTIRLSFNNII